MDALSSSSRKPYLILRPDTGWAALDLHELWQFRDLLVTLAMRDVKLRYRQTVLGVAWVVLQPLILSGAFTLVFGLLAKLPTNGLPTFVIAYAGLLGLNAFTNTVTRGGASLVGNAHLVSKVYFPRMALPISTVVSSLIDFGVSLLVLVVLMIVFRIAPGPQVLLMPVFLALLLALGTGVGLMASALTVTYRDVQYIIPVMIMVLQYVSPAGYLVTSTIIPPRLLPWYMLNPLAGLIEGFRWSLLRSDQIHWGYIAYSAAVSGAVLFAGALMFKRMERKFADVI